MSKFAAKGTVLSYLNGSTYVPITQLRSYAFDLGGEADKVDVTTFDNADNYRDFVSTWLSPGSVTLEGVYDPTETSHAWLRTNAGTDQTFKLTYTNTATSTEVFTATVGALQTNGNVDGSQDFSCPLAILGASTHTAAP